MTIGNMLKEEVVELLKDASSFAYIKLENFNDSIPIEEIINDTIVYVNPKSHKNPYGENVGLKASSLFGCVPKYCNFISIFIRDDTNTFDESVPQWFITKYPYETDNEKITRYRYEHPPMKYTVISGNNKVISSGADSSKTGTTFESTDGIDTIEYIENLINCAKTPTTFTVTLELINNSFGTKLPSSETGTSSTATSFGASGRAGKSKASGPSGGINSVASSKGGTSFGASDRAGTRRGEYRLGQGR